MPHDERFKPGEVVRDGLGNVGRPYRFWSDSDKTWYWRIRIFEGPKRTAGKVWVSPSGWRPDVDYSPAKVWNRCEICGIEFKAPKLLIDEVCKRCNGGEEDAWDHERHKNEQIRKARAGMDRDLALLRKKGA